MKFNNSVNRVLFACLSMAILVSLVGCASRSGENGTTSKKIPLKEVYSTTSQKEMKPVGKYLTVVGRKCLQRIRKLCRGRGTPEVFLVAGNDINEAVLATEIPRGDKVTLNAAKWSDVRPARDKQARADREKAWVFIYFGTAGSVPPQWLIKSVIRKGKNVAVHFVRRTSGIQTNDSHCYFAWIPLGDVRPGFYTLKLFDESQGKLMLARGVYVENRAS